MREKNGKDRWKVLETRSEEKEAGMSGFRAVYIVSSRSRDNRQ
jgi:hypothetical protein